MDGAKRTVWITYIFIATLITILEKAKISTHRIA